MDCANSVVLIQATFQMARTESDFFWTNTLSMCASNGPIPEMWGLPAVGAAMLGVNKIFTSKFHLKSQVHRL